MKLKKNNSEALIEKLAIFSSRWSSKELLHLNSLVGRGGVKSCLITSRKLWTVHKLTVNAFVAAKAVSWPWVHFSS